MFQELKMDDLKKMRMSPAARSRMKHLLALTDKLDITVEIDVIRRGSHFRLLLDTATGESLSTNALDLNAAVLGAAVEVMSLMMDFRKAREQDHLSAQMTELSTQMTSLMQCLAAASIHPALDQEEPEDGLSEEERRQEDLEVHSDYARDDKRHLALLTTEANILGARIVHNGSPRYDSDYNLLVPLAVKFIPSQYQKKIEVKEFFLPQDFPKLKRTLVRHRRAFRQAMLQICEPGNKTPILQRIANGEVLDELKTLAHRAGGILTVEHYSGGQLADENGLVQISYKRYFRLKQESLTEDCKALLGWNASDGRLVKATYSGHVLKACLPIHYSLVYDLLQNDIGAYDRLPDDAKRPEGWEPEH